MMKIPYLRWLIALALVMAAVLNYIDRNILGLLAPTIQQDLGISDEQYATVINFFLAAYTLSYLVSGRIVDKIGVRLSLALFIAWWSVSNALTGFAHGYNALVTPNWPGLMPSLDLGASTLVTLWLNFQDTTGAYGPDTFSVTVLVKGA